MVEALKTTGEENQISKRRSFLKVLKDTLAVTGEEKETKKEPKTNE